MPTSDIYDFTVTRDDIINEALDRIGYLDYTETPDAQVVANAARKLNILAKSWMAKGLNLWRREECTLFLEVGKHVYDLGPTGDHCTAEINAVQSSEGFTTMRVAGVATDTTLEVVTTGGMTAGDFLGVYQTDGAIHWTTVASVTDADTVEATAGLTASASVGARVYHYASKIQRPLRVLSASRRTLSGTDTPLHPVSDEEYQRLSFKGSKGLTNEYYFDPSRDTVSRLHLWVTAASAQDTIHLVVQRPFQIFSTTLDEPDFPAEWSRALVLGLAYELCGTHGIEKDDKMLIRADRDEELASVSAWDEEDVSVYFSVDMH